MKYRIITEVNEINRLERYRVQYKSLFGWIDEFKNSYGDIKAIFYDKEEAEEYIRYKEEELAWKIKTDKT